MFRAGLIGCGRIGSEFDEDPKRKMISTHAGAYSAVDEIELVAASDLDEEKLRKCGKRWGIVSLFRDYREMLKKERLDIVSVCTWNSTHLEIIREAVENDVKAIFCEKPIAETLKSADEIIELCKVKNVILQIDYQRRFDKFHQDIRKFIDAGNLGRVQQVNFYYTAGIASTGSHMFDLLRFFFGDVEWVYSIYSENRSPNPDDPNIDGILKFRNGIFCSVQVCDVKSFLIFEMDCLGTKGRLEITHSGFDLRFYKIGESRLFSGYKEIFRASSPIDTDVPREFMLSAVKHLVECLKGNKPSMCSGEDGRASLELICAFHESARSSGKKIELPLRDSGIGIKSK